MLREPILEEKNYGEIMKNEVEPYLERRKRVFCLNRGEGRKLYCARFLADEGRGTVILSHGFAETEEKYRETLYYLLKNGYHVYMPEHCGHGRSYRLVEDVSLVHVDCFERYVKDLLAVTRLAERQMKKTKGEKNRILGDPGTEEQAAGNPGTEGQETEQQRDVSGRAESESLQDREPAMPFYLIGHSMGGGIAAALLAVRPELFSRAILLSPMIRPLANGLPWPVAVGLASALCRMGRSRSYVPGGRPYDGKEDFASSPAVCYERYIYYQEKRRTDPLLQSSAPSCGWFLAAVKLNRYLQGKAWKQIRTPFLLFQADRDTLVNGRQQELFVKKVCAAGTEARLIHVPGTKHEILNSHTETLEKCWEEIFTFLGEN